MTSPRSWAILTGEFPPRCGGVGDYTAQLARALADAGDAVTVFRPPSDDAPLVLPRVEVVTLPDHYGSAARCVMAQWLDRVHARVLIQYVPQAFGMRGLNVPFCRWVQRRFQRGDDVRVMFHEPYFYFTLRPAHGALAAFQRAMAALLLRGSRHVYVSTEAWVRYLQPYAPRSFNPVTLPIPSAIPYVRRPADVEATRGRLLTDGASILIGHFGTYGDHIAPLVEAAFVPILQKDASIAALCLGANSEAFVQRVVRRVPALETRLHAAGRLSPEDVSVHLQACDLLVQPYPDGVTTRRTSMMAALTNGRAVVTTTGELTEAVWRRCGVATMVPAGAPASLVDAVRQLTRDRAARQALASRAASVYRSEFALERTVAVLRETACEFPEPVSTSPA